MKTGQRQNQVMGGIILILVGVVALLAQFVDIGDALSDFILPILGLAFFAWGVFTRHSGWFIPAGILTGLGLGSFLMEGPFQNSGDTVQGGIFMLSFALGWILIPVVSTIVTGDNHWWALIPGGIMGVIGASLLLGDVAQMALAVLGKIWPVFLILLGLYIILRRRTDRAT